jgi:WD40 repeat protein
MAWPLSQDYNEAIQNPASSFADPELRTGQAVTNALGMPMPRSGNFADVYEFQGASGAKWAIKCFTREVPGLRERYSEISKHLLQVKLPFTVDFQYLEQGLRIHGQWFPVLKMQWVEGFLLNEFVRNNLDKPALLVGLSQIWLRMGKRLREGRLAHADLQHGNVILVPGSRATALAVKLIDYDGMFVPALAQRKSGEVGHPAYQHPVRLQQGIYSAEVDRLPLLAIACALRCLAVGGKGLWERFDNGDNLLFREGDLRTPGESVLFREMWNVPDAVVHDLVGYLTLGLTGPLEQVPLLHEVMPETGVRPLTQALEQQVTAVLGNGAKVKRVAARPAEPRTVSMVRAGQPQPTAAADWESLGADETVATPRRLTKSAGSTLKIAVGAACVLAVVAVGGLVWFLNRGGGTAKTGPEARRPVQVAQKTSKTPVATTPGKTPKESPPDTVKEQKPPDDPEPLGPPPKKQPEDPPPEVEPPKKQPKQPVEVVVNPAGPSPLDDLNPARIDPPDRHAPFKELVAVLNGYSSEVFSVAFSPDGKYLTCAGNDRKTLCLWDLTRKSLAPITVATEQSSHGVAWSPDSKRVAVGADRAVQVWEIGAEEPRLLFKVDMPQAHDRSVAYSEKLLAVAGNSEVLLVDVTGPKPVLRPSLKGHTGKVVMVAFSPDGKLLASAGHDDRTVLVWDMTTDPPQEKARFFTDAGNPPSRDSRIWSVALAADGQTVAAGCGDINGPGPVQVWDLPGPEPKQRWSKQGHERGFANDVAFAPDGKTLISSEGSFHGPDLFHAVWWNVADGAILKKWQLPERCATVAFAADGRHVALGCHNHKVYILRLAEKPVVVAAEPAKGKYVSDMQEFDVVSEPANGFSKGRFADKQIMIGGVPSPHGLGMHPPADGFSRAKYRLEKRWYFFKAAVGLNYTDPRKAASPLTFEVRGDGKTLWRSEPVQEVGAKQEAVADVRGVEILELRVNCPRSNEHAHAVWLEPQVTKEAKVPVVVEAPPTPASEVVARLFARAARLAVSPDGRYLAWDGDKQCHVLDRLSKKELTIPLSAQVSVALAFSPDSKQLAIAEHNKTAQVWNVAAGKRLFAKLHNGPLNCVAYSADGSYLVTGTGVVQLDAKDKGTPLDCAFYVRKTATGESVKRIEAKNKKPVNYVVMAADNKSVLACDHIHAAEEWDWKAGKLHQTIRTPRPMENPPKIQWGADGPRMLFMAEPPAWDRLTLWDLQKNQALLTQPTGVGKIRHYAWSGDGRFVALVPEEAHTEMHVLELASGKRIGPLKGHADDVMALALSRDGATLVSVDKGAVRLWQLVELAKQTAPPSPEERLAATFVGSYDMTYTGAGSGKTRWVMTEKRRAIENGQDKGPWKVVGNQVVITYDRAALGQAKLHYIASKDMWVGEHRQQNGQEFQWVLKRLAATD